MIAYHTWFQHPINISLKPWYCQRIHSLAREREVQPWLEATFVLPGASLHHASAQAKALRWHGDDREAEDYLPVRQHKKAYTLFLLWRISNTGACACWRCVIQPPHQATLDLLFLGAWKSRGHKVSSAESRVVGHLYVQSPMCCREKPLSKCSASQERTSTVNRSSSAQ